jgi:hypothetical protein
MLKRMAVFVLVVLALLVGAGVAGPYLTLYQLRTAIQEQDPERLADQVDFPTLRSNLKDQINARTAQATPPQWRDSPLSALALGLTTQLADHAVDALITPPGLASLMAGYGPRPATVPPADPDAPGTAPPADPFRDARTRFDNPNRFSVQARTRRGDLIHFVLSRHGLKWRLSNILLPGAVTTPIEGQQQGRGTPQEALIHA